MNGRMENGDQARVDPEFPGLGNVFADVGEVELRDDSIASLDRRRFMALSAATLGLVGLAGCRRPDLEILPYAQTPDNVTLGVPNYYATSMPKPGGCAAILVESNEGRPTKIEGNPKHPASLGATDALTQASILDLYSPDRSKQALHRDKDGKLVVKSWEEFDAFAANHFADLKKNQGEGLRFLIEDTSSPALRLLREQMKDKFPKAVWHVYDPIDKANVVAGTKLAFGEAVAPTYDFSKALRVVALDCDFLGLEGDVVANGRGFAKLRRDPSIRHIFAGQQAEPHAEANNMRGRADEMSRLYVIESAYTVTGTMADHRQRIPSAHIVDYTVALAKELTVHARDRHVPPAIKAALERAPSPDIIIPDEWIREVAADLLNSDSHGESLVVAGARQPSLVHALCCYINSLLRSEAVNYWEVIDEGNQSIGALAKALSAGEVKTLVVAGGNPAFNAPADLQFTPAPMTIRLGMFVDETSEQSNWHLPMAHYLESWGDVETPDGYHCAIQPLIAPLHNGRSALELFIQMGGYDNAVSYADAKTKVFKLLQESFKKQTKQDDELSFKRFIQTGYVEEQDGPLDYAVNDAPLLAKAIADYRPTPAISATNLEVSFHSSFSLFDGRYAWNGWLLELPDPITKLVWDNAAVISQKTARDIGVETGDVLKIAVAEATIEIPAFILPGQSDNSIALSLGWGKLRPSRVADGGGFNVYPIRTSAAPYFTTAKVTKTGAKYDLVTSQEHGTIPEGRMEEIIRDHALQADRESSSMEQADAGHVKADDPKSRFQWGYQQSDYREAGPVMKDIKRIALQTAEDLSIPQRLDGHMQWGMVIDLNSCTGCSACVIACQAENNTPIVGKHEVKLHRTMHWISLHRYFTKTTGETKGGLEVAAADDSPIVNQPMMCQHCEAAPCESVCPVNAAVHSPEGLNLQVYNRCIGTRYCSNNCPYKARRFNWFDFNKRRLDQLRVPTPFSEAGTPETLKMQKNPEVTVRMRGVMEKCTYCIQRIERAKIGSKVLAIKAGADKTDAPSTESDPKKEYRQGYAIRVIDAASRIVVPDGIIHTACEQACPTGAIVFGNVRDTQSRVYKLKNAGPDYLVLGNLNTKPRTSYLPRLRNLNPKLIGKEGAQ